MAKLQPGASKIQHLSKDLSKLHETSSLYARKHTNLDSKNSKDDRVHREGSRQLHEELRLRERSKMPRQHVKK